MAMEWLIAWILVALGVAWGFGATASRMRRGVPAPNTPLSPPESAPAR